MKDSFIFYKSFYDAANQAPDDASKQGILWHLVEVCLGIKTVNDIPFPASAVAVQALASVESAKRRYDKSVEDGSKGGTPSKKKYIPPDVWIAAIEKHGSIPKAAKSLGLAKQTLYNWVNTSDDPRVKNSPIVQKSKNPNVYVYDSVSVSESVYDNDSDKRNNNKEKTPVTSATDPNGSPPCPSKKKAVDPFFEQMRKEYGLTDKFESGADVKDGDT